MKRLKKSTIQKYFIDRGFSLLFPHRPKCDSLILVNGQFSPSKYIHFDFSKNGLSIITTARWKLGHNVHIKSYWTYPSTMKSLEILYQNIKKVYTELCDSKFREDG